MGHANGSAGHAKGSAEPENEKGAPWLRITLAVIAATAVVAAAAIPYVLEDEPEPLPPMTMAAFTLDENGDKRSLTSALPIDAGEDLKVQIWVWAPAGEKTSLTWIGTDGIASTYELLEGQDLPDGRRLYIWPSPKQYQPIGGVPGTEVVLACSAKERMPTLSALSLGEFAVTWPRMASQAMIMFDQNKVQIDDLKGPKDLPPDDVPQMCRKLQARMAGQVSNFAGIAFLRGAPSSDSKDAVNSK